MARQPVSPDDTSRLDADQPMVAARVAWLLQANRLVSDRSLRDLAADLSDTGAPCHPSTLSRIEQTGTRDSAIIRGYERALGLTPGGLAAAIDILARTFPAARAHRSDEVGDEPDPWRFEARVEAVTGGHPTGDDWMWFAAEHRFDRGLPPKQMRPLVDTLVSELMRSVGFAFTTRYEALSRLRCGAYGRVVLDAVREAVEAPYVPDAGALMSALGEAGDEAGLRWALRLLDSGDVDLVRAARLFLTNLVVIGAMADRLLLRTVPVLVRAARSAETDADLTGELGRLLEALPAGVRDAYARSGGPCVPRTRRPEGWSRTRTNSQFAQAERLAHGLTAAHRLPDQPLLARLLFELLYDHRPERVATSGYLLMASPFAPAIHEHLVRLAVHGDEISRESARWAVVYLYRSDIEPRLDEWLTTGDAGLREAACRLAGVAGRSLDEATVLGWTSDPGLHPHLLTSAGMAGAPVLDRLPDVPGEAAAADVTAPVGHAGRWWRRHGGAVRH